ncbi:integrase core domain-containing protein [Elsinoe australis]|uniref:Integrase core domain-containing protein n=1 Tax=Elsinoe australis TaxID=40998 RepID=A0A4U7ANK1_9PEZI|nr:integrase core domain-containing protein [Elsinoe australis]
MNPADGPSRRPDYDDGAKELELEAQLSVMKDLYEIPANRRSLDVALCAAWVEMTAEARESVQTVPVVAPSSPRRRRAVETGNAEDDELSHELVGNVPEVRDVAEMALRPRSDGRSDPLTNCDVQSVGLGARTSATSGRDGHAYATPRVLAAEMAESDNAHSEAPEKLVSLIKKIQGRDAFAASVNRALTVSPISEEGKALKSDSWSCRSDGVVCKEARVYVPPVKTLITEILRRNHDDPTAGHLGNEKTLFALKQKFYWKGMDADVVRYIKHCDVCQRHKVPRHRPYGELQSLTPPPASEMLQHWSMDFITDLPPANQGSDVVDSIMVLVDRVSKYVRYIAVRKDMEAKDLADVVEREILSRYGFAKSWVSDRGSLFTSKFWSFLCWRWKTQRRLSTAFHPQTDGATERQNQVIEQYLRCFINWHQDDWPQWLYWAEFAHNNAYSASLGERPFTYVFGQRARLPDDVEDDL